MSKKDKKQHKAHKKGNNNGNTIHTDDDSAVNVTIPKSGKRKRDSDHNTSLNASAETFKENIVKSKSKKRKKESSSLPENESTNFTSETIESQPAKKSKKDKKKKTPTTLGVVDVDILQQAEINFQVQADYIASLNSEEPVKKKKHSEKTKSVSFKELVEVTDLPSAKKKHKKLKDQDLMLEEATDSNESKQHSKKRKHKKIEVEIAPSDDLVGVNENKSEESTKKKKHKEKKEKVSSEKLNKTNDDRSEQPLKKKKNNKKEGKLTAAPPEEDTATSLKEGQEMDKNEKALQYLKLWQSSKSVWKFNKMLQIHLLNIMYDTSLLSDEDFQILLQYLDGLKGKGREKTKEDALKIFNNGEKTEVNTEKEDRARQLCQMLA